MSSGNKKVTALEVECGQYVMLDAFPYKPLRVITLGRNYIRLQDPRTLATKAMMYKTFDKAGYVLAEFQA